MYADTISFFKTRKSQKIKKCGWISTEEENIIIFWTIWEISMKYSGKMWLKVILKVIKSRLHPRSEKCIFGKTTEEEVE